jgi:hypothetical protein
VFLCVAQTGDIIVSEEALRVFGVEVRALGTPRMNAGVTGLEIASLDAETEDGVRFTTAQARRLDLSTDPIEFPDDLDRLELSARGQFGGLGDLPIGSAAVFNQSGLFRGTADFSDIGGENLVRIEILEGGNLVAAHVVLGGQAFIFTIGDAGEGVGEIVGSGFRPVQEVGFYFSFDRVVEIDPRGEGEPANGDEVRLLAEGEHCLLFLSQLDLVGPGLGSLTVTGLVLDPSCPADLDESRDVGFTDLIPLLTAWGPCACDCSADLNGDHHVGFEDLVTLLADWGPCPE